MFSRLFAWRPFRRRQEREGWVSVPGVPYPVRESDAHQLAVARLKGGPPPSAPRWDPTLASTLRQTVFPMDRIG